MNEPKHVRDPQSLARHETFSSTSKMPCPQCHPEEYAQVGRHRRDVFRVGSNVFSGTRFVRSTTEARPVTR